MKKTIIKEGKIISEEKEIKKVRQKARQKKETIKEIAEQEEIAKKKNMQSEVKAFVILTIIIVLVVVGGYLWYTKVYDENREPQFKEAELTTNETTTFKAVKYDVETGKKLAVINNEYLIEYKDTTLYKVMDMKTNILYEGEMIFTDIYQGIDNKLYVLDISNDYESNVVDISILENKEFKKVKRLGELGLYYAPIKYYDVATKESRLLGFNAVVNAYDEEMVEINKTYLYLLDDSEAEIDDYQLFGDSISLKQNAHEVITYDKDYLVIKEMNANKYGLYDIKNKKVVIKPQYEGLFTNTNKEQDYIAIKNDKYGIIDKNLKRLVAFEYDFIDKLDGYYVVAKKQQMALMNNDYQLITKFEFPYQKNGENKYCYLTSDYCHNTFNSVKINNKYILTTNYREYREQINYDTHNTYIINEDGTFETIATKEFAVDEKTGLIYAYNADDKKYTIYDLELKKLYDIDVSQYDYDKRIELKMVNANTLVLKLDSEIYFDYATGEAIDKIKDYEGVVDGITMKYDSETKKLRYYDGGELILEITCEPDSQYYNQLAPQELYYLTDNSYVIMYKE